MELLSDSIKDNQLIPTEFAFGKFNAETHVELCENLNPHFAWKNLPEGTRSLALVCHDPDVPSKPDDVNQEERTVPLDLPRVDFYHWLLVDIPPQITSVAAGSFSNGITPRGKPGPEAKNGMRQGVNDYTSWFKSDPEMKGTYFGYDGPCPPWNDELIHRYHFTLYALDVEHCPVQGAFTGPEFMKAIEGHVLEQAQMTGLYHIYPDARMRS